MKNQKNKQSPLKNRKFIAFAVGFALVGAAIVVYSRAATPLRFIKGSLSIGYIDAAPAVITKNGSNEISYESRSKEVSVSAEGVLYCVPQGEGNVRMRTISDEENTKLSEQVSKASTDPLVDKEVGVSNSEVSYRELFIDRDGVTRDNLIFSSDHETSFVRETVALLDSLCHVPGEVIPDSIVPAWQNKPGNQKISNNTIKDSFIPKAHAAGATATPVTAAESQQAFRVNDARVNRGVHALKREHCLNEAARVWAVRMAIENRLYHSDNVAPYNTKPLPAHYCGDGWAKVGENVGFSGIAVTSNNQAAINASNAIFDTFWNSPKHQQNIMDPAYTKAGYGAYKTADGKRIYITQLFWRDRGGAPAPAPTK